MGSFWEVSVGKLPLETIVPLRDSQLFDIGRDQWSRWWKFVHYYSPVIIHRSLKGLSKSKLNPQKAQLHTPTWKRTQLHWHLQSTSENQEWGNLFHVKFSWALMVSFQTPNVPTCGESDGKMSQNLLWLGYIVAGLFRVILVIKLKVQEI